MTIEIRELRIVAHVSEYPAAQQASATDLIESEKFRRLVEQICNDLLARRSDAPIEVFS